MSLRCPGYPISLNTSVIIESIESSPIACHQTLTKALSNRYLTEVENRLQKLKAVFAHLLPDVDIENALSSSSLPQLPYQASSPLLLRSTATIEEIHNVPPNGLSEALPREANGFEWEELAPDVDGLSDGMASLSIEPLGIGYLGMCSV